MKIVFLFCLFACGLAEAQTLKNCTFISKDPKCWESPARQPPVNQCLSYQECVKVKKVEALDRGRHTLDYICWDFSGKPFKCTGIVRTHGTNIHGLGVRLRTTAFDGCHVINGCGGRFCSRETDAVVDPLCD